MQAIATETVLKQAEMIADELTKKERNTDRHFEDKPPTTEELNDE